VLAPSASKTLQAPDPSVPIGQYFLIA